MGSYGSSVFYFFEEAPSSLLSWLYQFTFPLIVHKVGPLMSGKLRSVASWNHLTNASKGVHGPWVYYLNFLPFIYQNSSSSKLSPEDGPFYNFFFHCYFIIILSLLGSNYEGIGKRTDNKEKTIFSSANGRKAEGYRISMECGDRLHEIPTSFSMPS